MEKRMSFSEWQEFSRKLHERARQCRNQMIDRMRETAKEAGLDPNIASLHAHNAMCSFNQGHPWPEVNYSLCRKVQYLEKCSFMPESIASRIIERAWRRIEY